MTAERAEQQVLALLAERERDVVELTRELVAAPSPNPPGDERKAAEVARQAMTVLGYGKVETIARAENRPNVVGEVEAGAGRTLILNGHLDTKPPGDEAEWETGPYDPVVRDCRLSGLGSADMKGAVAAMIHAGGALAEAGALSGTLKVVLTADEEAGSSCGAAYLADMIEADAVLVGEPTGIESGWEYVAVASRGVSCFDVRTFGTQMHSSLSDRLHCVNASVKLARVLVRFADDFRPTHEEQPATGSPTLNPGVLLRGGVFYGVYPGQAEFGVDVRTVPGMTLERLQAEVQLFLDGLRADDPELDVTARWVEDLAWFPPCAIDPAHPLVAAARSAGETVLARELPLGTMPAATDGSYWAGAGKPCVPAFGPGLLPLAHRPNESVSVPEIVEASRIFALTALRYLRS